MVPARVCNHNFLSSFLIASCLHYLICYYNRLWSSLAMEKLLELKLQMGGACPRGFSSFTCSLCHNASAVGALSLSNFRFYTHHYQTISTLLCRGCLHRQEASQWLASHHWECPSPIMLLLFLIFFQVWITCLASPFLSESLCVVNFRIFSMFFLLKIFILLCLVT